MYDKDTKFCLCTIYNDLSKKKNVCRKKIRNVGI